MIKYFFMGIELVYLKFKNFVSFLVLHKIFQTNEFREGRIHRSNFFSLFSSVKGRRKQGLLSLFSCLVA